MKKIIFIAIISFLVQSCEYLKTSYEAVKFWQVDHPDNFIEEIAEEGIKATTGKDVDLSPFTGEERQDFEIFKADF